MSGSWKCWNQGLITSVLAPLIRAESMDFPLIVLIDGFLLKNPSIHLFPSGCVSPWVLRILSVKERTWVWVGGSPRAPWVRTYAVKWVSWEVLSLCKLEKASFLGLAPFIRFIRVGLGIPHSLAALDFDIPFAMALSASWRSSSVYCFIFDWKS